MMIKGLRHVGIVVADLKKSLFFYSNLLGFSIQQDMIETGEFINTILGLKNVKVRTIKMSNQQGTLLELLAYQYPKPLKSKNLPINVIGFPHLAITVSDLNALYKKLSSRQIVFISPPQNSPQKQAKVAFCRDPNGVYLELVQPTSPRN